MNDFYVIKSMALVIVRALKNTHTGHTYWTLTAYEQLIESCDNSARIQRLLAAAWDMQ